MMVLVAVSLLTILIIGLLGLVMVESRSSGVQATASEVRLLSDLPVNLVMGQIRKATETGDAMTTWANQPGMIRVYDAESTDARTGRSQLKALYKLYSSDQMEVPGAVFSPEDEMPPADWPDTTGVFTDLNAPVVIDWDEAGQPVREYPIVDPRVLGGPVEGFDLWPDVPGATESQPIPMPVRWLYVLENGDLVTPTGQDGNAVQFESGRGPTEQNPIVGRIAYWTDDECAKLNINTASEGICWQIPKTTNSTDADYFANRQPTRNEFQRYPGHPAGVCLSPVLKSWLPISDPPSRAAMERYYQLTPFIAAGGSNGGTNRVQPGTRLPQLDRDRLYTSVDELYFDPERQIQPNGIGSLPFTEQSLDEIRFFLTAHSRAPEVNLFNKPRISLWPIQEQADERNTLDKLLAFCSQTRPGAGTGTIPYYFQRAASHDLSASSNAGHGSSQSPSADWQITRNRELYNYLKALTENPIPGFGARFADKYPVDRSQILTEMVDYLRSGLNTYAIKVPNGDSDLTYCYAPPRQIPGVNSALALGESQVVPLQIPDGGITTQGFGRCITVTEAALVFYPTERRVERRPASERRPDTLERIPQGNRWGYRASKMRAFLLLEFFCPGVGPPSWSPFLDVEIEGLEDLTADGQNLSFPEKATVRLHSPVGWGPGGGRRNTGAGHLNAHLALFQPLFKGGEAGPRSVTRRNVFDTDPMSGFAWHSTEDIAVSLEGDTFEFEGGPIAIHLKSAATGETIQTVNIDLAPGTFPKPYVYIRGNLIPRESAVYNPDPVETSLAERIRKNPNDYHSWLIRPGDTVRSMEADPTAPPRGDFRHYSARREVPASWFRKGGDPVRNEYDDPRDRFAVGLRHSNYWQYWGHFATEERREPGDDAIGGEGSGNPRSISPYFRASSYRVGGSLVEGIGGTPIDPDDQVNIYRDAAFVTARGINLAERVDSRPGDWDNGPGNNEDGCFINKPDESNAYTSTRASWSPYADRGGYYSRGAHNIDGAALNHAPNRQIASAVMMGSLPTGVLSQRPWETLLFCPNPAGRTTPALEEPDPNDHIGFAFPRDHLLLDWFWMPVVEPYAVSEPFSTAGKINLNYEIMPFRYIRRRTALHGLMKRQWTQGIYSFAAQYTNEGRRARCYKGGRDQSNKETWYELNLDPEAGVFAGLEKRFQDGDLFRSASEICEIFMVPRYLSGYRPDAYPEASRTFRSGEHLVSYADMTRWWNGPQDGIADGMELTGDNAREAPYNQLYPRLTTKSNVYRVHYRVQRLQKVRGSPADRWIIDEDQVVGDYRGSAVIERYIDPNDPDLEDFATQLSPEAFREATVDSYYRFRVVQKTRFAP